MLFQNELCVKRCCSNDNLSHNIKLSQYEIYSNGLKLAVSQLVIVVVAIVVYCLHTKMKSEKQVGTIKGKKEFVLIVEVMVDIYL